MARKSARTLRVYLRLLRRDLKRSVRSLIRTKRTRRQLALIFTRPSFKTSSAYYARLRLVRKNEASLRKNVMFAYMLLAIGFIVMAYTLLQLSGLQPSASSVTAVSKQSAVVTAALDRMPKSIPTHLTIPDIGVDTALIQLGKNDDGTMQTPDSYEVVGWYKYSPTPGEIGPAVLVGHVDSYQGAAVFFRLKELRPGQKIAVTREDGTIATFSVTRSEQFDQDHFPTDAVYGNTDDAQLRLITCGGPFNHLSGEYTQNTVVFAVLDTQS